MKRKICVITGTRAEYGVLKVLMQEIKRDPELKLQILATGSHLSADFGLTYKEIEEDGFHIDEKVDIKLNSDTPSGIAESMGIGMINFPAAYKRLSPDIMVVLGDRYEIFAAVASAMVLKIPVAHISGGESTEGVMDDAFRHAISKMSSFHFTLTEQYRKNVIQLGEDPKRVFNAGALGLDNIKRLKLLGKDVLEDELGFKFLNTNLIITFHPATLESASSKDQFKELLDAVDELRDIRLIFTQANADIYGRMINEMIKDYVKNNTKKAVSFASMGQLKFFSTLQFRDLILM